MSIKLPPRLSGLADEKSSLAGAIYVIRDKFSTWMQDRRPVFFPEYTDHGTGHIEETLASAEAIIRDDAWPCLTPEDAAVLIVAIFLHDAAMHLSEDGFLELVHQSQAKPQSRFSIPADPSWAVLWNRYCSELSRLSESQLRDLFGTSDPIRYPPKDPLKLELRDRLVIGEFLRRNHHRLAHEIALHGVPGPEQDKIDLDPLSTSLRDIAGLVARSHGQALRSSTDCLHSLQLRQYLNVHIVFLMTIIRIADYLQIQSSRAPSDLLLIRSLRSPMSRQEWRNHDSIEDITLLHDDPEAVLVQGNPQDVSTYLRTKRLLSGLQEELDLSWAVLGETYGRFEALQGLGLRIRRVRSNLDSEGTLDKTLPFIPMEVAFVADPNLLRLLIRPLYGDDPTVAIRELLQNAVDACRELVEATSAVSAPPQPEPQVTVRLYNLNQRRELVISDTGVGMTPQIVRDYFFRAGASFRGSSAWKDLYETTEGTSRVLRSGRFGIGVLSAFLLGERISITTRHYTEEEGLQFSCVVTDHEVEIRRVPDVAVGTEVRIELADEIAKRLTRKDANISWYHLGDPPVFMEIFGEGLFKRTIAPHPVPEPLSDLSPPWHRVSDANFLDIHWRFPDRKSSTELPYLLCNGIRIYSSRFPHHEGYSSPLGTVDPILSVFDPDGKLPLNLPRNALAGALPFAEKLEESVSLDMLTFLLERTPHLGGIKDLTVDDVRGRLSYPGMWRKYQRAPLDFDYSWLLFTPDGLCPATRWAFSSIAPKSILLLPRITDLALFTPPSDAHILSFNCSFNLESFDRWIESVLLGQLPKRFFHRGSLVEPEIIGRRLFVAPAYWQRVERLKNSPFRRDALNGLRVLDEGARWRVMEAGHFTGTQELVAALAEGDQPDTVQAIAEFNLGGIEAGTPDTAIDRILLQQLGGPLIPFDQSSRAHILSRLDRAQKPNAEEAE